MITRPIKKDIRKYKENFFGGFSFRECAAIFIAGVYAVASWNTMMADYNEPNYFVLIPIAIPLAFGFLHPQELPLEEYIKVCFISKFVAPRTRYYTSENAYAIFTTNNPIDLETEETQTDKTKKKKKMSPKKIKKKMAKEDPMYKAYP